MVGFVTAIGLLLGSHAQAAPCDRSLPGGPSVPAPIILSTDCGHFRLETDGAVSRLPIDWLAKQNAAWRKKHGPRLTTGRSPDGGYVVLRQSRVIWRSAGRYVNYAGSLAFGAHEFAFSSRRGVFLTDLRGPERLVVRGRVSSPIGFTRSGELLVSGLQRLTVVSPAGAVLRRYAYRRSSSYAFDEESKALYFVSPRGMLSVARGASVRRVGKIWTRGYIGLLGRRLLTFIGQHHVTVARRDDASVVAQARWRGERRVLDAGPDVSDDGRLFALRFSTARPGVRRSIGRVYLLRRGENRLRLLFRHRMGQAGCGSGASLDWHGSSVLYRSTDATGVPETAILAPAGSRTELTPLLRDLPRISRFAGNAFWAGEFAD